MKVRKKDGSMFDAPDSYILDDGETLVIPNVLFMDSMFDDLDLTDEEIARHRPGYRHATDKAAHGADVAYQEMCDALSTAWMGKPRTRKERRERQKEADRQPPDLSDVKALRDAADEARRQYIERTVNAWRTER